MQLRNALCYALLTMTMAATCIQAESKIKNKEERLPEKRITKRLATLVVDDATSVARMYQQPKVIYRRLSKKSYTPPRPTYKTRRTKYGPPRTLKKPGKKHRGKNSSKHPYFPYPYKKRSPNPRYGPPKRSTMKPVYGPPKKKHRIYNGIGFGEPPSDYIRNIYKPTKPSEFTRTQNPEYTPEITLKPHEVDISSPIFTGINDNFSMKPFNDDFWPQQYESVNPQNGYGEPPVDSYGAPIKPNLRDLTYSTVQSYLESTSHLDEDNNFGPQSRPWSDLKNEPDDSHVYMKNRLKFTEPEDTDEIFVTPVPVKQNQELHLNSYSDIYNYRQEEKAKEEKKKKKIRYYQKNVKMLNQPWVGTKKKKEPKEEIIVGGQYAEPPARHVSKLSTPLIGSDSDFSAFINYDQQDVAAPISSYVNYKNSNMAFSPQNLNDAFSIVDK